MPDRVRPSLRASGERSTCEMLRLADRSEYYVVYVDEGCGLVVAQRTATRFSRVEDIQACFEDVERKLSHIARSRYNLLVDVRSGPSRNDDDFERAIAEYRGKLLFGFARNAALVATPAGRLQVQRYAKSDAREVLVTHDAVEAFAHLGVPHHPLTQL
jgi:hypothetical protein